MNKTKLIVLDAFLVVIAIVLKEATSFLPNIEVVTLLFIIFSLNFSFSNSITIAIVYSLLETLLYGVNIYAVSYFIVWILIVTGVFVFKKYLNNYLNVAIYSFICGLLFDLPFSLPFFLNGFNAGISYLLAGLFFSLIHAFSNLIIAVILFDPISDMFSKLLIRFKL